MTNKEFYEKMNEKKSEYKKRGIAIALASVMTVTGIAASCARNNSSSDSETTTITETQTNSSTDEFKSLYLSEDFNIDDENAILERANAIYDLSDKKISVEEIVNMIYLINDKAEHISFPSNNDTKKYEYLQYLIKNIKELLNDHMAGYVNSQRNIIKNKESNTSDLGSLIHAYMLIASKSKGKVLAFKMGQLVDEQANNIIETHDVDKMKSDSKKYYELFKGLSNEEMANGEALVLLDDVQVKVSIMNVGLTKEQKDEMDNNKAHSYENLSGFDAVKKLKIDTENVVQNAHGYTTTPNKKSKDDASKIPNNNQIESGNGTTKKVSGGKSVGKETKIINGRTTTKTYTTSKIYSVPKTTKQTTTKKGGKPVGTTKKHVETTTIISEEIVVPGEEFNSAYHFVDGDSYGYSKTLR